MHRYFPLGITLISVILAGLELARIDRNCLAKFSRENVLDIPRIKCKDGSLQMDVTSKILLLDFLCVRFNVSIGRITLH